MDKKDKLRIRIMNMNKDGLISKKLELEDYRHETEQDIVCLMKTKVNKDIDLANTGKEKYNMPNKETEKLRGEKK